MLHDLHYESYIPDNACPTHRVCIELTTTPTIWSSSSMMCCTESCASSNLDMSEKTGVVTCLIKYCAEKQWYSPVRLLRLLAAAGGQAWE